MEGDAPGLPDFLGARLPEEAFARVAESVSFCDLGNLRLVSRVAKQIVDREWNPTLIDYGAHRGLPAQPGAEVHELYGPNEGQLPEQFLNYLDSYVADAKAAHDHMVNLVRSCGKEGPVGGETEADRQAAKVIARYNQQFGGATCAEVFYDPAQARVLAVGANKTTDIPPLGMARLRTRYDDFVLVNEGQCYFMHAEIRIWEKYAGNPNLVYIGIDKLCCLYCAAQLLAAGFTGFRGCHMNTYKQYTFSNQILSFRSKRRMLFGGAVADKYDGWTPKQRLDFLSVLANRPLKLSNDTTAASCDYASDSDNEKYEKDSAYCALLKKREEKPKKKRRKSGW